MPLPTRDVTDAQWSSLEALIPEPSRRRDLRGRPWKDRRTVLNGGALGASYRCSLVGPA